VLEDNLSVSATTLLLQVDGLGAQGKDLVLTIQRRESTLIITTDTMGDTEEEFFLKIRLALELMRSDDAFDWLLIKLPIVCDLSLYGFKNESTDPKVLMFYRSWLGGTSWPKLLALGQGRSTTWEGLIAQQPVLHSLPQHSLSGPGALEGLPA
jgi:hypothetical protein